jgi:hypothetical protein
MNRGKVKLITLSTLFSARRKLSLARSATVESRRLKLLPPVILALIFGLLGAEQGQALTRRVPADHANIQQVINASNNGDTVLVSPGTYVENLTFSGKAITVMSEQGPQLTIIDGNLQASVVTFNSGEGPNSVLHGFTIRNGLVSSALRGGGITVFSSSPTISGNTIINNQANFAGGGIMLFNSQGGRIINNIQAPAIGPAAGQVSRCRVPLLLSKAIESLTITARAAAVAAAVASTAEAIHRFSITS